MDMHGAVELLNQNNGAVKGYVPRATPGGKVELVLWYKSTRVNRRKSDGTETPNRWNPKIMVQNIPVPQHIQQAMIDGLPPERRREARERYAVLVKRLLTDMQQVKAMFGRYTPPASIAEEIRQASWKFGDPTLLKRIENVEPSAVETYAAFLMGDTAAKQREQDRNKVTVDWHGHYNT